MLKESNRKPNKIWVDKGSEFYNNSFKKWLEDNDIEMYSTHNERKSVISTYIDFKKEVVDKDLKYKVGDYVRTSKYKNIFTKGYTPNW